MRNASERSHLIGGGSIYALATAAPVLSTLLVTPWVTRVFSPESYGLIAMTITLYQVGGVLAGLGMSAAITRHALINQTGRAGAAGLVLTSALLSCLFAALAAIIAGLLHFEPVSAYTPGFLAAAAVSSAALASLSGCQALLRADEAIGRFVIFSVAASLGGPLVGLLSVSFATPSPLLYVSMMATTQLGVASCAMVLSLRGRAIKYSIGDQLAALRFGVPTVPHQVAPAAMVTALVLIVAAVRGAETAGQLQIGFLLANGVVIILGAMNNAWAPMIYKANPEERAEVLSRTALMVSVVVLVLLAGFAASIDTIAPMIAGTLDGSGVVSRVSLIGAFSGVFAVFYLANIHLVFLKGNTGPLAITTPSAAAIATGLSVWLVAGMRFPLECVAMALPIFNAIQVLLAYMLRRATMLEAPCLTPLIPNSLFGAGLLTTAISFPTDSWPRWLITGAILLIAGIYNRLSLRNRNVGR